MASSSSPPPARLLVDQGIAAIKREDRSQAFAFLVQALALDPAYELAWLWLSGIVMTDGERRFCLERVITINPQNAAAHRGLTLLPAHTVARSPLPAAGPELCTYGDCQEPVNKAGFKYCYKHWKLMQASPAKVAAPSAPASNLLSATVLGDRLGLSSQKLNALLSELGWTSKDRTGWLPTPQGISLGAVRKIHQQTKVAFVVWPETILGNKVLQSAVRTLKGESEEVQPTASEHETSFRERFPARHRTTDGHLVRSRAELLIDNWLYMAGIVHAYERQLPIEEEAYCDFYIPAGKVYVEYWGLERDPNYATRRKRKQELYQKYHFQLIELTDDHILNLDDHLPKLLLKYNVIVS